MWSCSLPVASKSNASGFCNSHYLIDNNGVTVRLFGSTDDGHSACIHVTDYRPYFYALAPSDFREEHVPHAIQVLNELGKSFAKSSFGLTSDITEVVLGIDIVHGNNLYGYRAEDVKHRFLKIYVISPRIINNCEFS